MREGQVGATPPALALDFRSKAGGRTLVGPLILLPSCWAASLFESGSTGLSVRLGGNRAVDAAKILGAIELTSRETLPTADIAALCVMSSQALVSQHCSSSCRLIIASELCTRHTALAAVEFILSTVNSEPAWSRAKLTIAVCIPIICASPSCVGAC